MIRLGRDAETPAAGVTDHQPLDETAMNAELDRAAAESAANREKP